MNSYKWSIATKLKQKASLIGWWRFMVISISNPDKIVTDLGSRTTTDNRTTTGVISATGPHLFDICGVFSI